MGLYYEDPTLFQNTQFKDTIGTVVLLVIPGLGMQIGEFLGNLGSQPRLLGEIQAIKKAHLNKTWSVSKQ